MKTQDFHTFINSCIHNRRENMNPGPAPHFFDESDGQKLRIHTISTYLKQTFGRKRKSSRRTKFRTTGKHIKC